MVQSKQQAKYLDPEVLSKIGSLDIIARQVVEGLRIGLHRSPSRGISSEFTAYRQYVPGDETGHIDWKAYARCNRYYIKLFDAETDFVSNLLIDAHGKAWITDFGLCKVEDSHDLTMTGDLVGTLRFLPLLPLLFLTLLFIKITSDF